MSSNDPHMAHPRLVGMTAQVRTRAEQTPTRPIGPDDLPIENQRSAEEAQLAEQMFPTIYRSTHRQPFTQFGATDSAALPSSPAGAPERPFVLRSIGLLLRRGDPH